MCGKTGLRMYIRDAAGTYTDRARPLRHAERHVLRCALVDMNGDGLRDLVGLGKTKVAVYPADGRAFGAAMSHRADHRRRDSSRSPIWIRTAIRTSTSSRGPLRGRTNPDVLLENDGTGQTFGSIDTVPASGDGHSVASFDYDGNGTLDLVVMNGYKTAKGPMQLLSFPPQP